MKSLAKETKNTKQSNDDRIATDVRNHREEFELNAAKKVGRWRGKFRNGDAMKMTELDQNKSNKDLMAFKDWKRK